MKFNEYNSLTGMNLKNIQWYKDHPEVIENILFNVTEKIHGCNYSFNSNAEGEILFGKRSSFIPEEAKFYGQQFVIAEYVEGFKRAVAQLYTGKEVNLYGELFGGSNVPNYRPVQVEVYYCDGFEFAAFDLRVDGEYMPYTDMKYFCEVAGIPTPALLGENLTFWEALKIDNTFNSKWSEKSEEMEGNVSEGTVISPTETVLINHPNGDIQRLIFKNKSVAFLEKHTGKKPKSETAQMSPEQLEVFLKISEYITPQRFYTVISKMLPEEVSFKNFKGLLDAYVLDVIKEVETDGVEVSPTLMIILRKPMCAEAAIVIRTELTKRGEG